MGRLENLLGAQALALTDRLLAADAEATAPASASERAALVTLLAHPDPPTSWLGEVLGLTSSGITRLVDRLVAAGWLQRSPGGDARSRELRLTPPGRRRAEQLLAARADAMAATLAPLTAADRAELERLLAGLVHGLADSRTPALRICRLCDRTACQANGHDCPLDHTTNPDSAEVASRDE